MKNYTVQVVKSDGGARMVLISVDGKPLHLESANKFVDLSEEAQTLVEAMDALVKSHDSPRTRWKRTHKGLTCESVDD